MLTKRQGINRMLWSIDGTSPGGTEGGPEYIYRDENVLVNR